jgi:hypothetical protein
MHHLTGFDSVDDETKPERPILTADMPHPEEWNMNDNPSYVYYLVRKINFSSNQFYSKTEILVLYVCKYSYIESTSKGSRFKYLSISSTLW